MLMGDKYIAWLSNLSKKDLSLAGGKGANLGEMSQAKFPVPGAFVVTTKAFHYFIKETKIQDQINEILRKVDVDESEDLMKKAEEIRGIITSTEIPEDLKKEIIEAYDNFNIDLDALKDSPGALAILKSSREPIFVSVRSSSTAEDLENASFAGQQKSFLNIKGNQNLLDKVKEVFASIFTARSIYYRKKKGFESFVGIAVIVQEMINADKSGVMFSNHPVKNNKEILIEAVFGLGEGIVSGKISPDQYLVSRDLEIMKESITDKKIAIIRTAGGLTKVKQLTPEKSKERILKTYEIKQLAEYALKLEEHYKKPQDIEFSIEGENIYILQTRPITALKEKEGGETELEGRILTEGLAASPGVASGKVKIINSMDDLSKIREGNILVTKMTNPDMVISMQKASAIVTSEGGVTAHAAIVSREMGIPAVVGTRNALEVLEDDMEITVDGSNGKVFSGLAKNKKIEILPIVETKTKIKVLVDLPEYAERSAKTNANGVGLVRLEGIIASDGKHPLAYEKENKLDEYKEMLKKGLEKIANTFIGKPIWVRSSDIRSDEYSNLEGAPKKIEKNPMLGDHGIRFSLKHPGIFKAELKAIQELANKGHKFGVMFPQIISIEEIRKAKEIFKELNISNVQFGVMIETPAATILIKDICEEKIDFISFGTNDLTQYTLAIDRGNEEVQYLYNELNWAVLKQISRVIRECKKHNIETSICGQAGSNKEVVKFLVKQGIDSISVNADVAKEISEVVKSLEEEKGERKEQIENIDNKESLKEEIEERQTIEQERIKERESQVTVEDLKEENSEPTSDVEVIHKEEPTSDVEITNHEEEIDNKKEDIFT
jgi:pyruvate,water dikinase